MLNNIIVFENYGNVSYDNENIERLKSPDVFYMELVDSKFRCHDCNFYEHDYCKNIKVQSKVSDDGCCNLYYPKKGDAVDSEYWHVK